MTDHDGAAPQGHQAVQGTGLPIRPASNEVVPYGQETLDEVFNEDQSLMDPADVYDTYDDGAAQEAEPDSADQEEQPTAQPQDTEQEATEGEETIDLPDGVTLEYLDEHHPSLAKVYRGMQADYTRKTQKLAEERKGVSALEQKAQMWDELASNSDLVSHIRNFVERGETASPHTTPQNQPQQPQPQYDYGDDLDDFTPEQQTRIRALVNDAISQEVKPYVQDLYAREATREIKTLEESIPGFKEAYPDIKRYREQNGNRLTWQEAARNVLFDRQREDGMREALAAVARKKRVSSVNGHPTPSVPRSNQPAALPEKPSLDQALEFAMTQHRDVSGFQE